YFHFLGLSSLLLLLHGLDCLFEVQDQNCSISDCRDSIQISHVDAGIDMRYLDRKSTRLNSSHSQISYAVFCLKKKKNKLTTNTNALLLIAGNLSSSNYLLKPP